MPSTMPCSTAPAKPWRTKPPPSSAPFYWRGHYPDGRAVLKTHTGLQNGWRRYRNAAASAGDGRFVARLFRDAHETRKKADYDLDGDFTGANLNRLTAIVNRLIPIIDAP